MKRWSQARRLAYESSRALAFWQRLDRSGGRDACWLWTGPRMWNGYGKASFGNRTQNAHRVAWMILHGELSVRGLHIDHVCRVKLCCNPRHLDPVTCKENLRRSPWRIAQMAKTHCPRGHPYSGSNLRLYLSGRQCATCRTQHTRERRARLRASA